MNDTQPSREKWAAMDTGEVLTMLETRTEGLADEQVLQRIQMVGSNTLPETDILPWWVLFVRQFRSPLLWVLLVADLVAFGVGEFVDATIIAVVLILNGVIATIQEGRAQATLASLRHVDALSVTVRRNGTRDKILAEDLVPGDIVILHAGDRVPADIRLLATEGLRVTQAALTGESLPVLKVAVSNEESDTFATLVLRESLVVEGDAEGVVVATGSDTMVGEIADQVRQPETEIPLQRRIRKLTNIVVVGSIVVIVLVFFAGILLGKTVSEMLLVSISLLVSVIPEGLPVVMTLVLATGVKRMADQSVLVKRLQAVEALGHTEILAVDKTGTITKNELSITRAFVDSKEYEIGGIGYSKIGDVTHDGETINPGKHPGVYLAAQLSNLSANSHLDRKSDGTVQLTGDPTEAAFLVFGEKFGFDKSVQLERYPMLDELPFDFKRKYYANAHNFEGENLMMVTGAPEAVLPLCSRLWTESGEVEITEETYNQLRSKVKDYLSSGLRVLVLAIKHGARTQLEHDQVEELTCLALLGMQDVLRQEVQSAVAAAESAGMRVVMITGDHPTTAEALARDAGICTPGETVLTGAELADLDTNELHEVLRKTCAFARVTPDDKLRIVNAYKEAGYTIAMTGDGVNDGPSLAAAHLGVAMGKVGTEVAKDAADVVLLNDDFGMIPKAAEEGRHIYFAIQKVIAFLFSTNLAELLVIIVALLLTLPLPLSSAQIVWLNLVTDSALVLAIGLERGQRRQLMSRDFSSIYRHLIPRPAFFRMMMFVAVMVSGTLLVYTQLPSSSHAEAATLALTVLVIFQLYRAWSAREGEGSNWWLVAASVGVLLVQFLATVFGPLQRVLGTTSLSFEQWVILAIVGSSLLFVDTFYQKWLRTRIGDWR